MVLSEYTFVWMQMASAYSTFKNDLAPLYSYLARFSALSQKLVFSMMQNMLPILLSLLGETYYFFYGKMVYKKNKT